jgi:hypothetical protein
MGIFISEVPLKPNDNPSSAPTDFQASKFFNIQYNSLRIALYRYSLPRCCSQPSPYGFPALLHQLMLGVQEEVYVVCER